MDPVMYIFLNRGASMSTGKAAAQAAHASLEAFLIPAKGADHVDPYIDLRAAWRTGGHYKKLVMLAEDEAHLLVIDRYLQDRGFRTALIVDEGLTEVRPHTATALGVEIVDKDDPHTAATFSTFRLYREEKPTKRKAKRVQKLQESLNAYFARWNPREARRS